MGAPLKYVLLLLGACAVAQGVQAQSRVYTCKDAQGRTYTSDRPIPECADRPIRELNRDGTTRREIMPQLTGEQRRQKELEEQKKREEEALRREQERKDKALLASYGKEEDIELARKRALSGPEDIIKGAELRLKEIDATKAKLREEAEFYKKRQLPHLLKVRVEQANGAAASEQKVIAEQQEEMARINARFDGELQRYRDLTSGRIRPGDRVAVNPPASSSATR